MNKLVGLLLLLLSAALALVGVATVVAMIRALTVDDTLAAIESAFGSLVVAVIFLVLSRLTLQKGLLRLRTDTGSRGKC